MKKIQPEKKIDVGRLSMNLSKVWTTRKASKILPMTKEQAADMLKTVFRLEVESRWKEFVETPSISKSIDRIAGFLTGETHKTGLFISGRVGNGKTTMMKSIMKLYDYLVSEDYVEYGGPMSALCSRQRKTLHFH